MKNLTQIALLLIFSLRLESICCQPNQTMVIFLDPNSKSPKEDIGTELDVKRLTLVVEENHKEKGWKVMPPLSAGKQNIVSIYNYDFFIDELPPEYLNLSELEYLDISSIGVRKLPDLSKFPKLERLDISYNPINISEEIENLSKLSSLKVLNIQGCVFGEEDINLINQRFSNVVVLYRFDQRPTSFFYEKPMIATASDKTKLELLENVYQYYSVGLPNLSAKSRKYKNYKSLLDNSVTGIRNKYKDEAWKDLMSRLGKEFPEIRSNSFIGFPSRSCFIPISEKESDNINEKKCLFLDLSLMSNHYTLFIESVISLNNYKENGVPIRERIIYGRGNSTLSEQQLINRVKESVDQFYKNYEFVEHQLLMSSTIEGVVPHGEDLSMAQTKYSLYSLLFSQKSILGARILK